LDRDVELGSHPRGLYSAGGAECLRRREPDPVSRLVAIRVLFAAIVLSTAVLQYREIDRLLQRQDATVLLQRGIEAPLLGVERLGGGPVIGREELADRVVVLSFWASWCLPCRAEMPELARFVDDWNQDPQRAHEAQFVAVNVGEDPDDIRSITEDPLYGSVMFGLDPDGEAAARWRASSLPSTFVVGPDGTVLDVIRGYDPHVELRLQGVLRKHRKRGAQ
jgi:thiol-disulfide isomerase/thioredoxin